ncbi:ABC transporter ATP-binding protein [Ornithinimicrobium faecis]|uniref:ABC transporter ATP-binding protein n=1 Tax=Ornithinimicrobium faecis TaxID=2934158 RepID=UPI0021188EE9|nr:ABC transporter ATP-binding protein [Ornithinimicrobium sp. HY1745]
MTSIKEEDAVVAHEVEKVFSGGQTAPTRALAPVTMRVDDGEFVSLVGHSGCGKTTLLKICAKILQPSAGTIEWPGYQTETEQRYAMMVFQSAALLPWKTVVENVAFPAKILKWPKRKALDRARELIELVKLQGFENHYPAQLSGGMQQRVSIARALLVDPKVLFMDEPFGALDAMTRDELNILLQDLHHHEKKSVLFVTHNIPEAVFLSDRVYVMHAKPGRIAATIEVPIPRPRSLDVMTTEAFGTIERELRASLNSDLEEPQTLQLGAS